MVTGFRTGVIDAIFKQSTSIRGDCLPQFWAWLLRRVNCSYSKTCYHLSALFGTLYRRWLEYIEKGLTRGEGASKCFQQVTTIFWRTTNSYCSTYGAQIASGSTTTILKLSELNSCMRQVEKSNFLDWKPIECNEYYTIFLGSMALHHPIYRSRRTQTRSPKSKNKHDPREKD